MKELEDLPAFPSWLRDFQTEYIGALVLWSNVYRPVSRFLQVNPPRSSVMTDLCSGSGAPARYVFNNSGTFGRLKLTDKFPNSNAVRNSDEYSPESADVLTMDIQAGACYTMFNAFHHFDAVEQRLILERIRTAGASCYFAEILRPDLFCLAKVLLMTTIGTVLLTPFVRPFSLTRLFFTYVLPLNVFTITWDGIVSVVKSSTEEEYRSLLGDIAVVTSIGKGIRRQLLVHIAQP